jgi:hypothetical protein
MDYRIFSESSGEDESSIEAHVLARAYRAVWRCTYGTEPAGRHKIAGLQLVIDFGRAADMRVGNPDLRAADFSHPSAANIASSDVTSTERSDVTSSSRCDESASATADVQPDNDTSADLWARVRLFGKRMRSEELELLIAELREQDRIRYSESQQGANCRNRRRDD